MRLGFVSPVAQEHEQIMVAEIWKAIGGDEEGQGTVPLTNCKNIMRAVQNFHHHDIMASSDAEPLDAGIRFSPTEISIISSKYRELFKNRQEKVAEDKRA